MKKKRETIEMRLKEQLQAKGSNRNEIWANWIEFLKLNVKNIESNEMDGPTSSFNISIPDFNENELTKSPCKKMMSYSDVFVRIAFEDLIDSVLTEFPDLLGICSSSSFFFFF